MLTKIYALVSIAILLLPVFLIYLLDKRHKRLEKKQLIRQLSQEALRNNLSFTSQELLSGLVFGLDGIRRQLLVVEKREDGNFRSTQISLDEIQKCTIWNVYAPTTGKDVAGEKQQSIPSKIILSLQLQRKPDFTIVFYWSQINDAQELHLLEKKAGHWEVILSKLATPLATRA